MPLAGFEPAAIGTGLTVPIAQSYLTTKQRSCPMAVQLWPKMAKITAVRSCVLINIPNTL
jgi:hypothetical protein